VLARASAARKPSGFPFAFPEVGAERALGFVVMSPTAPNAAGGHRPGEEMGNQTHTRFGFSY
jgi:hypothetical protein